MDNVLCYVFGMYVTGTDTIKSVISCFYTSVRLTDNDYTAIKIMQIIKTCELHSLNIHTYISPTYGKSPPEVSIGMQMKRVL